MNKYCDILYGFDGIFIVSDGKLTGVGADAGASAIIGTPSGKGLDSCRLKKKYKTAPKNILTETAAMAGYLPIQSKLPQCPRQDSNLQP